MQILQVDAHWAVSDIISLLSLMGGLLILVIGWAVRMEIRQTKMDSKIDSNTERDKDRETNINNAISGFTIQLKELTTEIHSIKEWITKKDTAAEIEEKFRKNG